MGLNPLISLIATFPAHTIGCISFFVLTDV
jgi:hypothetical protein